MRTGFIPLNAYASGFAALRTNQHHIRKIHRALEFDQTRVDSSAALGLNLALMLGAHVDTLHNNPMLIWNNPDNFAAFAFVFKLAIDDLYSITFTNLCFHHLAPVLSPA
jgi:hypothetical protein